MLEKRIVKKYSLIFYTIISVVILYFLNKILVDYILNNSIIKNIYDLREISVVVFAFIVNGVYAIAGVTLYRLISRRDWKNIGFKFRKREIYVTLIGLVLLMLIDTLFMYGTKKMNLALWSFKFSDQIVPLYLLYAVLIRFLFVGIGEEFFFRGFLFKVLEPYGRLVQYCINVLFFVSVHFVLHEIYPIYFLGLIIATFLFCYIYDKTGSIWPGVILHGAIDLLATLFSWNLNGVSFVFLSWKSKYNMGNAFQLKSIIANIFLIMLVWYFYKRKYKNDCINRTVNK